MKNGKICSECLNEFSSKDTFTVCKISLSINYYTCYCNKCVKLNNFEYIVKSPNKTKEKHGKINKK